MEELSMEWPPAISSLEPLRPLSPDVLHNDIADLGFNVGKLSRSEIAGKLLDHLDELAEEEPEPFDWFATEKSIDLPLFDSVPSPSHYKYQSAKQFHNYAYEVKNQQCMQEYAYQPMQSPMYSVPANSPPQQCVSQAVSPVPVATEWVKAETLTPPDSPKDEEILKLLQEIEPNELEQLAMARKILQEIEPGDLEELVTRVDDGPATYSENSCSVDEFSDGGVSSPFVGSDSGMEDPEWSPPRRMKNTSGYSSTTSSCAGTSTPKRKKPYSRPAPEERKLRKKEQNKNAATRYRLKKKAEVEEIRMEEKQLQDKNKALKNQLDDISREVKYLKSLMRDVYRKKGLIK